MIRFPSSAGIAVSSLLLSTSAFAQQADISKARVAAAPQPAILETPDIIVTALKRPQAR
jgi:hypothetical protein